MTYCNTLLQHTTATYDCNTILQHTTSPHIAYTVACMTYCNTFLQHITATHECNTLLQHSTATHHCTPILHVPSPSWRTATHHCNTPLQHTTATHHYSTPLQHTIAPHIACTIVFMTYCNKLLQLANSFLSKTAIFPKKEGRKRKISNKSARGSSLREANV